LRREVWEHIKQNAKTKDIFTDTINGYQEHCHCLISLGADQTMSKILQLLKGESSHWINKNKLCRHRFEWQDEYFGASVSESNLEKVRAHIRNQEEHHKSNPFNRSLMNSLKTMGFKNSTMDLRKERAGHWAKAHFDHCVLYH
jgi:putative transposase